MPHHQLMRSYLTGRFRKARHRRGFSAVVEGLRRMPLPRMVTYHGAQVSATLVGEDGVSVRDIFQARGHRATVCQSAV
eukprot:4562023-Amphidinium_carterae.1